MGALGHGYRGPSHPGPARAHPAFGTVQELGSVAHAPLDGRHLCSPAKLQRNPRGSDQRPVAFGPSCSLARLCCQPTKLAWPALRWSSSPDRRPHRALLHHSCAYAFPLLVAAPAELDSGYVRTHQPNRMPSDLVVAAQHATGAGRAGCETRFTAAHAGREYRLLRHIWQLFLRQAGAHGLYRGRCTLRPLRLSLLLSRRQSGMEALPDLLRSLACCFVAQPFDTGGEASLGCTGDDSFRQVLVLSHPGFSLECRLVHA